MNIEWTLTVLFVLLKLTGVITWSWWWLLVLLFFYPMVLMAIIIVVGLIVITAMFCEEMLRFLHKMVSGK